MCSFVLSYYVDYSASTFHHEHTQYKNFSRTAQQLRPAFNLYQTLSQLDETPTVKARARVARTTIASLGSAT
jgi:hypothetical protein